MLNKVKSASGWRRKDLFFIVAIISGLVLMGIAIGRKSASGGLELGEKVYAGQEQKIGVRSPLRGEGRGEPEPAVKSRRVR